MARQMHLIGWLAAGPISYHTAAWRYPTTENSFLDAGRVAAIAQELERAKFDAVFFADGADFDRGYADRGHVHFLDLIPLVAVLAHETSRIGIGMTQNSTANEPYNLARTLGSLDYLSGGRIAWNVVTGTSESEMAKYGKELPSRAERYERAAEVIESCQRLWTSLPAEAIIGDKATGRYIESDLVEEFSYRGKYVSTVGPLPVPQSPQGGPVILQAGASTAGRALAAEHADVVFIMARDADRIRESVEAVKSEARKRRRASKMRFIPAVSVVVAETRAIAEQQWAMLTSLVNVDHAIDSASYLTGVDLRSYPLDMPMVDFPEPESGSLGLIKFMKESAEAENLTLAETAVAMTNSGIPLILGDPEEVADQLVTLFRESGVDGFMVHAPITPSGFEHFARMVVPILQQRGLFRKEYEGTTLRQHLFG